MRAGASRARGLLGLTVGLSWGGAGCAPAVPSLPPPGPPPPAVSVAPVVLPVEEVELPAPAGVAVRDEILRSPMARHPEFRGEVERWVEHWGMRSARWFPQYLERMAWFAPSVDSALARRGLPPSLRYLPIIESGYSPRAVSQASAVGLWQFMEPTARGFGMHVGPLLDERRNPYKSTEAAVRYLAELRDRFDSWFLALAAYNSGPGRVERILRTHAPLAPRSDSLFWEIRPHLPRETRDFVPKFIAAALVAGAPGRYGFDPPRGENPFVFDEVVVPDATTLDVVALAAETDVRTIERLNPEFVRGITPPGKETFVRIPAGRGWSFRERYAQIPPDERVTYVEHRVRRGETLGHIAVRYGIRVSELRAANPGVRARALQVGQRLTVPVAGRRRPSGGP